MSVRNHRIRGDDDTAFSRELDVIHDESVRSPRDADRKPPYALSLFDRL